MDYEARARDDHHDSLRLWLRLLTCTQLVEGRVRRFLRADFDTTLPRFDLLAQLERQPKGQGQRMSELSKRLMVTGGNVTGITDQLVSEGLVARTTDPADRRSFLIELTPAGRKAFADMARQHEELIRDLFGGLKAAERAELLTLLAKLKHSLNGENGAPSKAKSRGTAARTRVHATVAKPTSRKVKTQAGLPARLTKGEKHGLR